MIYSFSCKETEKIWNGQYSKRFPVEIQERSLRKLRQLDVALTIEDLKNPPGNHLESLKGSLMGQMSIRINRQWRICFIWENSNVHEVKIIDYH
ncbi:type II toxin-antitoxin system RelE/ParE family toxin [Membranihabitans maritimus]|uniref:type II toxin-antitoxin system RelE/ParE family toxin n=1 Tax=Membranihabitans maritimus TaxID=2904244 RepID=UPI001F37562C|nr:type II toxin-antitoxin system RelE/ParE family toxin [Membranihabitans maritimus]